jgi:hypothetical protein
LWIYHSRERGVGVRLGVDRRDQLVENLARRLDDWRLTTPAIAFLETHRPLSFLASQSLLALQPLLMLFLGDVSVEEYATLLEDPSSVQRVICRLEELRQRGIPPD